MAHGIIILYFKYTSPFFTHTSKKNVIKNRTGFYDACGQGIFCNLGDGDVDFPTVRKILIENGFEGWCTVEQDCDPLLDPNPLLDAKINREYLESIGFS